MSWTKVPDSAASRFAAAKPERANASSGFRPRLPSAVAEIGAEIA